MNNFKLILLCIFISITVLEAVFIVYTTDVVIEEGIHFEGHDADYHYNRGIRDATLNSSLGVEEAQQYHYYGYKEAWLDLFTAYPDLDEPRLRSVRDDGLKRYGY